MAYIQFAQCSVTQWDCGVANLVSWCGLCGVGSGDWDMAAYRPWGRSLGFIPPGGRVLFSVRARCVKIIKVWCHTSWLNPGLGLYLACAV